MVGRRRESHDIITLWHHTPLDNVGHGIPSSPLGSTHNWTTLGVAFHHSPWKAYTLEQRGVWHVIFAIGQHPRLDDVGRGIPGPALLKQTQSDYIWRVLQSSAFGSTYNQRTSGMTCHHRPWATHTIKRRQVSYAIITLG